MAPQPTDTAPSAMDQLRGALGDYVSTKVGNAVGKVGEKVASTTKRLDEFATGGGNPAGGDSGSSDSSPTSDSSGNGSGGGAVRPGSPKVTTIVETLDVGVPLRTAYEQWTQYEEFSKFSKGVSSVSTEDELTSTWDTHIAFSSRRFEATVQEQVPDDRIVWTSEGAKGTTQGVVTFHELAPTLTRIVLVLEYSPSGFVEKTGNLWRAQGRRVRLDVKNFQSYVTLNPEAPEGWRGEIRDGEVVRTDEEVRADEEQPHDTDSDETEDTDEGEDEGEDEGAEADEDEEGEGGDAEE